MLLDAFQALLAQGFPLRDYHYLGMGSVFFWDYLLFHKLLGMRSLTSAEIDTGMTDRVRYNKPFRLLQIEMKPIASALETLDREKRHVVWMDYDSIVSKSMLADATQAGTRLGKDSICLITVDLTPPADPEYSPGPKEWIEYYRTVADKLWNPAWEAKDFAEASLWERVTQLLVSAIQSGCTGQGKALIPLFHFLYRDGDHWMMTLGGMFGGPAQLKRIRRSDLPSAVYYRGDFHSPYKIHVPRFTRRERFHLDQAMPREPGWRPGEFETDENDLAAYSDIYRFLPAYAELLL